MAHEKNITKSYKVGDQEIFYNTPDPTLDVPDMSLPKEYGKQYRSLKEAVEGAKSISKKLDKFSKHKHSEGGFIDYYKDIL